MHIRGGHTDYCKSCQPFRHESQVVIWHDKVVVFEFFAASLASGGSLLRLASVVHDSSSKWS
jgi:hypothetical protein